MADNIRRATMIARDQRALLRRIANIYPGPGGGMDPSPGGGGYSGPGGGKYIGPSRYAEGGKVEPTKIENTEHGPVYVNPTRAMLKAHFDKARERERRAMSQGDVPPLTQLAALRRGSNVYVWHGMEATHDDMAPLLGIDKLTTADRHRFTRGDAEAADYDAHKLTTRATGGSVPPFKLHSGAAKIIKSKGQAKATPQQYAAMPGIKPDELKYSKFDTLGSKALPREEVIKHLEDNALSLEETQLGGEGRNTSTKFDEHQLPGGKNYREVLLHTPGGEEHKRARLNALGDQGDALLKGRSVAQLTPEERAKWADLEQQHNAIADADDEYKSGHWETPNVLAHVRMSDRVGPNGEKILHLEEAQSDWGQQGRERGFDTPDRARRMEEIRARGGEPSTPIPLGPYVDNTQKWTDLALKRVLHEAAHGGYDRIVVTPGDEQNKRYDLSNQVKNIQYYPDLGYLHATTHEGEGVEHDDVKPEDLSKHIGKEAADRILKQGMQRYEGRGKLGGEFYHELEGDGLKVGGAGMRGYYDNILPKRLQALAQQHDPQAKVNLHAHDLSVNTSHPDDYSIDAGLEGTGHQLYDQSGSPEGPEHPTQAAALQYRKDLYSAGQRGVGLHSLDVTPQMRDSIKANGFNSFKRGGDVDVAKKPSTPAIKKTLDLRPAEAFPELATRYPTTAPPEWAHDPKKKVDYLAKRLSPEALAVQTAKKVIQKDIEEGRYKPYFDPLKRYDASSPEFGVKAPTTGIKKVKPETQAKYDAHARSPAAIQRLSGSFERGMLQPREASDWYLMGQLHNEYVAKHGPKIGSQLFKERFADAMSATTGGADPTSNFLTSHYGNYVKAHKQQFPEKSYDLPFPIGGRYIGGNIDQFNKMIMQGKGVTPANPKRYNFSHNFLGNDSGSTIDEQMSGQFDPKMSVPPEGTYGHYEEALADLAKKTKGAKSPRHFQEVAWAGAKDMGTKGGYKASPMISHINQSIERTSRLTGLSPDEVVAQNLVDVKGPMFKKGGRAGYAPGGGVEQLQQNLRGAFSDLNRQVAAQGPQQAAPAPTYQAMNAQATGQAPNDAYQRMMAQALNGKTYEEMFPTSPKVAAPAVAPVQLAAADAMPYYQTNYDIPSYGPQGGSGGDSGGSGDGLKRGGRANKTVERALAITRKVKHG